VRYNIHICGTETVSSSGPLALGFDIFSEGETPKTDALYKMSQVFISSNEKCKIETVVLANSQIGEPMTSTLVTIIDDSLVVDISQG
jgi:hypothetical protein